MQKICPICDNILERKDNNYSCKKGHSFDISSKGYVNLLVSNASKHGDTKEMVRARREFLNAGHYQKLSDIINDVAVKISKDKEKISIIDAGCGEGYYTKRLYDSLSSKLTCELEAFDVSKEAVLLAAKLEKAISFSVASIFKIPIKSHQADLLLNLFAPICEEEFRRTLKRGGHLIVATPNKKHLWELKQAVYDNPYENEPYENTPKGFKLVNTIDVSYEITIEGEQIENLFSMTPYYWKTSIKDKNKLKEIDLLKTKLDFLVLIYQAI